MPPKTPEKATVEVTDAPAEEPTTTDFSSDSPPEEAVFVKSVKYVGAASKRVITAAEFSSLGSSTGETVWGLLNDFLVPFTEFDEPALKYLKADGRFTTVG